eukprot:CAMPEP_0196572434 /NCGR_PEP_ID=MMETSP1081-20130531/2492_1 /TAXON_ID=36882 /ORGANISM="Pyramimonas amylifera, Strain CCMP720" /LENGTH=237 /DNA_ID=CAMNT_0041889761 /DNA_START=156 /DNA_END=869 /DNA_ORIENTATION=-
MCDKRSLLPPEAFEMGSSRHAIENFSQEINIPYCVKTLDGENEFIVVPELEELHKLIELTKEEQQEWEKDLDEAMTSSDRVQAMQRLSCKLEERKQKSLQASPCYPNSQDDAAPIRESNEISQNVKMHQDATVSQDDSDTITVENDERYTEDEPDILFPNNEDSFKYIECDSPVIEGNEFSHFVDISDITADQDSELLIYDVEQVSGFNKRSPCQNVNENDLLSTDDLVSLMSDMFV